MARSRVLLAQVQSLRTPPGHRHQFLPPLQLCQYHFHAGCTAALSPGNAGSTGVQQEWQNGVRTPEKPHYFFIYRSCERREEREGQRHQRLSSRLLNEEKGRQKRAVLTHPLWVEESFQGYFPLVFHLLCIKGRAVSILLHSVIQSRANHCCWGWRQPVGNSLFKCPSCWLFTCYCPDWGCLVTLEKGYG